MDPCFEGGVFWCYNWVAKDSQYGPTLEIRILPGSSNVVPFWLWPISS